MTVSCRVLGPASNVERSWSQERLLNPYSQHLRLPFASFRNLTLIHFKLIQESVQIWSRRYIYASLQEQFKFLLRQRTHPHTSHNSHIVTELRKTTDINPLKRQCESLISLIQQLQQKATEQAQALKVKKDKEEEEARKERERRKAEEKAEEKEKAEQVKKIYTGEAVRWSDVAQ